MSDFENHRRKHDKTPSILKRDADNRLDRSDANRVTEELVKKLITTERDHQKDISFRHSKSQKRDVYIMVTLMHRNTVDGKIVLSDTEDKGFVRMSEEDPFKYKIFDYIEAPIEARHLPISRAVLGRQLMGIFKVLVNWLARIGAVNDV